jgi:glycosyltransferase involved in cell wall biosynthesis
MNAANHGPSGRALVSVIMPCYNGERYLAEAIESALQQTYRPIEVIVVDDGSTDRSRDVAEGFGDRIRRADRAHSGIAGARNHGVALAGGEYLAFLDADDLWSRDKLERQVAVCEADPTVGIVIGDTEQFVSPELEEQVRARLRFAAGSAAARMPGAVLIRRAEFDRVGSFRTELASGEFMDWFLRADALRVKSASIPGVVYRRRIHGANHGILRQDARGDYLRVIKAELDRRRRNDAVRKHDA